MHTIARCCVAPVCLAVSLLCLSACEHHGSCVSTADCEQGYACVDKTCRLMCLEQSGCDGSQVCLGGVCRQRSGSGLPEVEAVAGNALTNPQQIVDGLIVTGRLFDGAEIELRDKTQTVPLSIRSQSADRIEAVLPVDVRAGLHTVAVTNAAGTTEASVTLSLPDLAADVLIDRVNTGATTKFSMAVMPSELETLSSQLAATEAVMDALAAKSEGPTDANGKLDVPLTGTVTSAGGTAELIGSGTFFTTAVSVGDGLRIGADAYTVVAVTDDTHLTLGANTPGYLNVPAFVDGELMSATSGVGTRLLSLDKSGNLVVGSPVAGSPGASIEVFGQSGTYPADHALGIHVRGKSPVFFDQVLITGDFGSTTEPYGIAFAGDGHHRGGIYAINEGGTSSGRGEIHVWARDNGDVVLDGRVGIGTSAPQRQLHVYRPSGASEMILEVGDGMAGMKRWNFVVDGGVGAVQNFSIRQLNDAASGGTTMLVINGTTGDIRTSASIYASANVYANNVQLTSSRSAKRDIEKLPADQARDAVMRMQPVSYRFTSAPEARHLGFIAEDVPDLVAQEGRKTLNPMDIVAALTSVVQTQQAEIDALRAVVCAERPREKICQRGVRK